MTRPEIVKMAIAAHGQWKTRLKAAVESRKSEHTVESASTDRTCEFGKLLYGDPSLKAGAPVEFEKVRKLHAEFHQEVGKVLTLALAGKQVQAMASFEPNTPLTKISSELTLEMLKWSRV